jgi:AraC family transcriptional regulator of adaptative response/methylated-DNA-[protein]-cysteine methyltransferase
LREILLGDERDELLCGLQRRCSQATVFDDQGEAGLGATLIRVIALVEAPHAGLALPLDVRGTPFQQRVWQALRQIPAGRTVSYIELAGLDVAA